MKASTATATCTATSATALATVVTQRRQFLHALAIAYGIFWLALAWSPRYRQDWALENVLVLLFAALLWHHRRRVPLSRTANGLIAAFLLLHAVGAHYTYSEVPYREWLHTLGFINDPGSRNHFDRLVHFCYGLLLAMPVRELCHRTLSLSPGLSYGLPLLLLSFGSTVYEWVEWGAAIMFGGDLGIAYVGSQGDPWDAQKDMLLATSGAVLGLSLTFWRSRARPNANHTSGA
ncbi:MAG TPA: DUF2238 domain-containing protein [Permianibacter sp.]|nr:DUF2238 domain-containing protein [Permianibacter sp.]